MGSCLYIDVYAVGCEDLSVWRIWNYLGDKSAGAPGKDYLD